MMNIGLVHFNKGNHNQAIVFFKKSKIISDNIGLQNTVNYAWLMMSFGLVYDKLGEVNKAGPLFRTSYDILDRIGHTGESKV